MESTGAYSEGIAEFLYNSGFVVDVINPSLIKAFRMNKMVRQKTDRSDSEVIAVFVYKMIMLHGIQNLVKTRSYMRLVSALMLLIRNSID
jgi:transposase